MAHEKTDSTVLDILHTFEKLNSLNDVDTILDEILSQARGLAQADAGSIFLLKNDELIFSLVQNNSFSATKSNHIALYKNFAIPVNSKSIVGHCATSRQAINIDDAYNLPDSNPFKFNEKLDKDSGYRTTSILSIPLITFNENLVGVLQLLNAKDADGNSVPFSKRSQTFVPLFANHAAVAIERGVMNRESILRMMKMAELRDPKETGAHVQRVGAYSAEIYQQWATKKGLPEADIKYNRDLIRLAAMLHDVGKVGIPDAILKKPGKLTAEEFTVIKQHTVDGAKLFSQTSSDLDIMSKEIALHHHEKWNGKGYPGIKDGNKVITLTGEEIPLAARITALADVFDALCSARSYKEAWDNEKVCGIIKEESGQHFDPEIVDAFFEISDIIEAIRQKFN